MAYKCPHCGADLPENAAFCPHCARDIHPRREAKKPVPLLKKLLLGMLVLAVLAAVGTGLWLALGPKVYEGYGEVLYGDYQVLLTQSVDRYVPAPEVTISGEPEVQYRVPSRLFINDIHTGEDASEAFLAEVEAVTAAFTGQEDSPSPFLCSEPAYNPGAPECPLISLIDFTGESGTAELVWTFQMKNGDTITLRQTYEVTPIPVYDYYPEEHPMDTAEELQALIDSISGQVEEAAVVNLHLPPVTYEGGVTIQDWNLNLYGSTDGAGNRTTFTGPVRALAPYSNITYFYDMDFVGDGGTGLSGSAPFRATNCTFTGWDTAVLAYGTSWANVIGCTFRNNGIGFHFDSDGEYANHSMYNDNLFEGNEVAVQLDSVPTDVALNFQGSVFRDNGQDIVNTCDQPLDTSQAIFS
ncbi:zinc ribbon domain-containing protein [Intestinimonas aquisgranensis]|nr:zinc ribbon domain-containing protein [Intestinimonas aquisgranensis]